MLAGVSNETVQPDLDSLARDSPIALVRKFLDNVNNTAVENIVMDEFIIFKTRSVGIQLCPTGTAGVADPDADFVNCVSL